MEDRMIRRQFTDGTFMADADCQNEEVMFSISHYHAEGLVLTYEEIMDYAKFMRAVGERLELTQKEENA